MVEVEQIDRGVIEYSEAWDLQKAIFGKLTDGSDTKDGYLLLCEHPHVYTLGKSGHQNNLLVDNSFLESIGATFFKIDRGGDITYHGYGQLVGYPILNLERFGLSLRQYIELLEQAVINSVAHFGIEAGRVEGATGVWITDSNGGQKKICAIGVKASRYITMHGFALNVNTNLDYFNYINPCGFTTKGVTSLKEILGREVVFDSVKEIFAQEFASLFVCNIKK